MSLIHVASTNMYTLDESDMSLRFGAYWETVKCGTLCGMYYTSSISDLKQRAYFNNGLISNEGLWLILVNPHLAWPLSLIVPAM